MPSAVISPLRRTRPTIAAPPDFAEVPHCEVLRPPASNVRSRTELPVERAYVRHYARQMFLDFAA